MLETIAIVIYRKKYNMKRRQRFFLISEGSVKFLIHKNLFNHIALERNINKILAIMMDNKELIIYRT